jgi:hypothetical protein
MSNGSDILTANLNVTIDLTTWILSWNSSSGFYEIQFNGSDSQPGLGTHSLFVQANKHGSQYNSDGTESLIIRKDPSSIQITWPSGYNVTYVEQTKVVVFYRMSNGTAIQSATVNITISGTTWPLVWNSTSSAYERVFNGNDDPPGLGTHTPTIMAQGNIYVAQSADTQLIIRKEPTTATPNWWAESFVYANSTVLSVEYRDTYGALITGATQRIVIVNGTQYTMSESAGTYWYQMDYRLGMGYHTVQVNISKAGYEFSYIDSIHFNITENPTQLYVTWSATNIDYVGQSDLTVQYWDVFGSRDVTIGMVVANLTIDGSILLPLTTVGNFWIVNLTGVFLDLGAHDVVIRFWAPNYQYQENYTQLVVSQVTTDPLLLTWEPNNVTIEYVQSLNLTVDYTFNSEDVPGTATVNVTIDGITYDLLYSGGLWRVSIPGDQVGVGVYNAAISAWLYGYTAQSNVTYNVNVTLAANSFVVYWEPIDGMISFVEEVNISVVYTYDYLPILDATVKVFINGTRNYTLVYSAFDDMWHTTLLGSDLGLGLWNATVTANRTGHQTGSEWNFLSVTRDLLQISTNWTVDTIDYVSSQSLLIGCNSSEVEAVMDANILVEIGSQSYSVTNEGGGFYSTILGPFLSIGVSSVDITISGSWFYTSTLNLSLTVDPTGTQQSISLSNLTIYYDQYVSGSANYTMLNGSFVLGSNIEISAAGLGIVPTGTIGSWSFEIYGDVLGAGNHSCYLNMSTYGYEPQILEFYIVVELIPTGMSIHGPSWMYVNDTSTMRVQWADGRDGSDIDGENIAIQWSGAYSVELLPSGAFNLTILTYGLASGNYSLNVTLTGTGYWYIWAAPIIEVRQLPLNLVPSQPLVEYEMEEVTLWVYALNDYHDTNVTWAEITATFEGEVYSLSYDSTLGIYIIDIQLDSSHSPGVYMISISALADDFIESNATVSLTILEKSTYSFSISLPSEILPSTEITVTVYLHAGGTPVPGQSINLLYVLSLSDESHPLSNLTLVTGSDGTVSALIQISEDAVNIEVWAVYQGSREAWAIESDHADIEIEQESTEPSGPLTVDPVTITLVGGTSAGALVLVLIRKRRGIGSRTSTAAISAAASVAPSIGDSVAQMGYGMAADGSVRVPDISDSVSEFLGLSSEDASSYATYLSGLGIVTTVTIASKSRTKKKPLDKQKTSDRMKELLRSSSTGLTRAEIADSLNISIRKTRELVSELLKSGEFEEIQKGRRRMIKFKK